MQQAGGAASYANVTVKYVPGHNPDLVTYSDAGRVLQRVDLKGYRTKELHLLLAEQGFKRKASAAVLRRCTGWVRAGLCKSHAAFMHKKCAGACSKHEL